MTQSNLADEKIDFIVDLLTMLDCVCFNEQSNRIQGSLSKTTSSSFEELNKKLEHFDIDNSDNDFEKNLFVIPLTSTNVYFNVNHYLKNDKRRLDTKPLNQFYLYQEAVRYIPEENNHNILINKILTIAELFTSLKLISDITDNSGNRTFIIFVSKKNLKINSNYVADDLNIDFVPIRKFIKEYLQNDFHQEDRHLAVINGLHESYKNSEIDLSEFLKGFDIFYKMVKSNFQLYMDKFSFNEFKNNVEEERRDYTIKINKVFSDMQNQLLTLPIATVLAAGQMVLVESAGDFIKNTLIAVGIIIFCIFVLMQISNQKATLDALDVELGLCKDIMNKKDDTNYKAEYLDVYSQLDKRVQKLNNNLELVKNITLVATILVLLVFFTRFFI